jgi:hypothetical protein
MPRPLPNETKEKYISRCIEYVVKNEGTKQDQAIGKCYGLWDHFHKNNITEKIERVVSKEYIKGFLEMPIADYINLCAKLTDGEMQEESTTTADIDVTPTADTPKKKKKRLTFRRSLQKIAPGI